MCVRCRGRSAVPVDPGGGSTVAPADGGALLESSREWIQLEAPCLKSLSSSAVSLLTILSVLTLSICASACGSLPGGGSEGEREGGGAEGGGGHELIGATHCLPIRQQ